MVEKKNHRLHFFIGYRLEFTVFIGGMVIMIFELVGSRILAPYVGTSIFVWTSLIGIILTSLSIGYWWGGKLADKKPSDKALTLIMLCAAIGIGSVAIFQSIVLTLLVQLLNDIRVTAVVTSIILFALPSVFLGMISPFAVKLRLKDIQHSGATVGRLSAISTIGSIVGTFLGGFVLISYFGSTKILFMLSVVLLLTTLLLHHKNLIKLQLMLLLFLTVFFSSQDVNSVLLPFKNVVDHDTQYNRVWIYDGVDPQTQKPIRTMSINGAPNSAIYLHDDELVFPYARFYRLVKHFHPGVQESLLIGGAGYSYPRDFLKMFPKATIDVVEIDPGVTDLARKHFRLQSDPRMRIYHEDGRVFLNKQTKRYDAIFIDAFNSTHSLPYHLTTQEAFRRMASSLKERGVLLINVIGAIDGEAGAFLRAEYATLKTAFPYVYVFPVENKQHSTVVQNLLLVAVKSEREPSLINTDKELAFYLSHLWGTQIKHDKALLTDDYVPVEQYILSTL